MQSEPLIDLGQCNATCMLDIDAMLQAQANDPVLFTASHLTSKQAGRAFGFAQWHVPHLDPAEWKAYLRQFAGRPSPAKGLMIIEDRRGYVHGMFCYRSHQHLSHGRQLYLADIVVAHLPGRAVAGAVIASGHRLAREASCAAVVFDMTDHDCRELRLTLAEAGAVSPDGQRFILAASEAGTRFDVAITMGPTSYS